jgi:hypothetical protein
MTDMTAKRNADREDWRGKTLRRMRALIKQADPDIVEELKEQADDLLGRSGGGGG